MDEDNDKEHLLEDDYYTFLNIPRNATQEEINNAYRRQSKLYHPDKHVDPVHKKEAEVLFNRTKEAYKVLSNPHQRAIYDSVGIRGLQTDGWEIVERTKTPQEIREEYEHLAKEAEERKLMQLTNPTTSIVMNINATDLFDRYDDDDYEDRNILSCLEVSGMSFTQSIEAPLTLQDTVTLYGQVTTQNGIGSGSVNFAARRLLSSKGWVEVDFGAGNGPMLGFKGFRVLPHKLMLNGGTILEFTPVEMKANLVGTLSMELDTHTIGQLTYNAGPESAMSTAIVRDTSRSYTSFRLQFGIQRSFLSLNYTHKMEERGMKLRGGVKVGTFGVTVEYGAEKKISRHSKIFATVCAGVPTGVALKIKLKRSFQTYSFPIQLSDELLPATVFYATVVPLVTWVFVKKMVIDPMVKKRMEREKEKEKEVNKTRMMEKQKEAESATKLMSATVSRIRAQEEAKKGLIITKALYGRFVYPQEEQYNSEQPMRRDEVIDVTIPLQCLVKDSKLILYDASKSELPGFYDPCVGEEKQLLIQYLFRSRTHECIVKDNAPVRIPLPSHRVNTT
ncbi:dnaJ homolog subfamily C member 11 isoform X2 [Osmia bicornis bicornis]|uniref:dnaJ homolog subfamily C member 11 isoform X2 n=1 Tax=Osmia bicornis bicornis TaxID=1437191 RepID=UPI0010F4D031|nr:dnaJ homolog subfamily C member 11 isoform X2 [Osmia bicornis bicornis]